MKVCRVCGIAKKETEFPRWKSRGRTGLKGSCKVCTQYQHRQWYQANKDVQMNRIRNTSYRYKYGLIPDVVMLLLEHQQDCCGICLRKFRFTDTRNSFHIDHDHVTGQVRGLLCGRCNTSLGGLRDNPMICRSAARYLEARQADGSKR